MRKYTHFVGANLTEKQFQQYQMLLKRFGKGWPSTKSASFRELIERLSESMPYETRWDNPGFDSFDEETSEAEAPGPNPEVVCGEPDE